MYNQMTDQYKLVQTEIVKAAPVIGRTISAVEGYSLEIFRWGEHFFSVRISGAGSGINAGRVSVKTRVNNGDVIYKVKIVPSSVPIVGNLTTKDKHVRIYGFTVDLMVSDPVLFVKGYRLGKDPLNLVIGRVKSSVQEYASRTEHDKLVPLRRPRDEWNKTLSEYTGMMVTQISQWDLKEGPKRDEAFTIQLEAENKKKSINAQAEIKKLEDSLERERDAERREHERHEQTKQRAFEYEEDMLHHMHKLYYRLRETAAQELTDILRERIRYAFERGTPIDEVAEDSLKLLKAFHESLNRGSIVDAALPSGSSASTNGASPGEDTTIESDLNTDPSMFTPPDLNDLAGTEQKETGEA
jgi:hypothetical protein